MLLLKWCAQCASKFGKLSSGHRTEKGLFSFQSQRRSMPKNVQTTTQLRSFHMQPKLCSKFLKLGFSSTWTENLKMYKWGLEKIEEPEIKLPTSAGSQRKQKNSRKTSILLHLLEDNFSCIYFSRGRMTPPQIIWHFPWCGKQYLESQFRRLFN